MFSLDPHCGVPIYRQLLDQIRRLVASGQLAPGTELPSIRDVALRHAVNPMTVSKAYVLLEAEGMLERHRGKPMRIAEGARTAAPRGARARELEPYLDQLVLAARQLQYTEPELIKALRRRWDGESARSEPRRSACRS